ncbi:AMP-binding protein, partial [Roseibium sp. RKSG952]|uniref:AMP-binding protein n=1 Tax=Roseibium sp. RKSG952 TaxID=2529384 RepID=UPI0012BB5BA4
WKAGAAYLPLDPEDPDDRRAFMLKDAGLKICVTSRRTASGCTGLFSGGVCGVVCDDFGSVIRIAGMSAGPVTDAEPVTDAGPVTDAERLAPLSADCLAYQIYTSGSTGRPKGVMVGHAALSNRLAWMQQLVPLGPGDVVLQKTPANFDVSVWELFWWACHGAQLVMLAPGAHRDAGRVAEAMAAHQVGVLHFVPSLFDPWLDLVDGGQAVAGLTGLRAVFTSGEPLAAEAAARFHRLAAREGREIGLYNLYGPTETAVDVTACQADGTDTVLPIGAPVANTQGYVVDPHL